MHRQATLQERKRDNVMAAEKLKEKEQREHDAKSAKQKHR